MKKPHPKAISLKPAVEYGGLIGGIAELLEAARRNAARTVNALMTATYWEIGRRIVEFEQGGNDRAGYGEQLLDQLSVDLTSRFGRGFGRRNLFQIRAFYLAYRSIVQTSSAQIGERADTVCTIRRPDSLDSVNRIAAAKKPDTVWPIGSAQSVCAFSFAMVALCAAALRERRTRTRVLSRRD